MHIIIEFLPAMADYDAIMRAVMMVAASNPVERENTASRTAIARLELIKYIFTTVMFAHDNGFTDGSWQITNVVTGDKFMKSLVIPAGKIPKCEIFLNRGGTASMIIGGKVFEITRTNQHSDGVLTVIPTQNAATIVDDILSKIENMMINNEMCREEYRKVSKSEVPRSASAAAAHSGIKKILEPSIYSAAMRLRELGDTFYLANYYKSDNRLNPGWKISDNDGVKTMIIAAGVTPKCEIYLYGDERATMIIDEQTFEITLEKNGLQSKQNREDAAQFVDDIITKLLANTKKT